MHLLARQRTMSEKQAREDILDVEVWILCQDGFGGVPRRQHGQDMLHSDPHVSDDRLPAEDVGANGNPIKQFSFSDHDVPHRFYLSGFVNPAE